MKESALLKKILVEATKAGARLFRNNVGLGWTGKSTVFSTEMSTKVYPGDVLIRQARPLHSGLCKGSHDLIGWTAITISPDMIGQRIAVFTGVEAKTKNVRVTKEQQNFHTAVQGAGGKSVIAYSVDEALSVIQKIGGGI